MNVTDYTYLMNKPDAITEKQADALGSVLNEFPYFQSARALRLKGLYNQNSFKYNYALKVAAAHTSDRSVLFDFITSEAFTSIQNDFYEQKLRDLLEITVFDSEIISTEQIQKALEVKPDAVEESISVSIQEPETPSRPEPAKVEEIEMPEIDLSIFNALKKAQTVVFEEPVKIEEPKTLPIIDESIFATLKEAQSVTYEKPIAEEEKKIDPIEQPIIDSVKETETVSFIEPTETEEPKIDRIENSILSSIKVSETPSAPEAIEPVKTEEPKIDSAIERSILNSIKEAEAAIPEGPIKADEPEAELIIEEPILNSVEEDEDDSVIEEMIIPEFKMNSVERSILSSIKEAEAKKSEEPKEEIQEVIKTEEKEEEEEEEIKEENEEPIEEIIEEEEFNEPAKTAAEHLEIGKPLDFSLREKHSFQEWLQLSRTEPIDRSNDASSEEKIEKTAAEIEKEEQLAIEEKQKKAEIIDKFIENNPKISPIKPGNNTPAVQIESPIEDNSYLMTETLARVYLEQKKYTKAIQAYEILILKYPEKITFFADRISDIKILQQNNNNNN
ncbi:tetratricopeptide repeat protein [Flavobacterium ginsenosidimutans]|uniref:Tetratricopeptide repeat protein n=1 Tax=Flavobacterium ginsenosidimutans TaxID=687844 RepID=A0ABZ2QCW8_9FLAO